MKSGPILDPELRALLREITTDPRSRLMKLVTQGHDGRVRLHEPPISEGEPFLTRAERHLVREHREDVAVLLGKAAQRELLDLPAETPIYRFGLEVPDRGRFGGECQRLRSAARPDEEALRVMTTCTLEDGEASWNALALATASLALFPRDETRLWIGLVSFLDGDRKTGRAVLADIGSTRVRPTLRSMVEQSLAFEDLLEGHASRALEGYRRSSVADPIRAHPLLGWMQSAIVAGDRNQLVEAASRMHDLPQAGVKESIMEHVSLWHARRRAGLFRPTEKTIAFVRRIRNELDSHALEMAELFAGEPST